MRLLLAHVIFSRFNNFRAIFAVAHPVLVLYRLLRTSTWYQYRRLRTGSVMYCSFTFGVSGDKKGTANGCFPRYDMPPRRDGSN
jgi:hypothetical protein